MNLYITEKPSVARIIKDYLNNSGANFKSTATNKETDSPFFFDSNGNCIAWCAGHLLRLLDPKNTIQSTQAGMKRYFPSMQKN